MVIRESRLLVDTVKFSNNGEFEKRFAKVSKVPEVSHQELSELFGPATNPTARLGLSTGQDEYCR